MSREGAGSPLADPLAALRAGLAESYRLERELGRGGMARVYLAHDLKHDRPVALKVLHPDLGAALGAERFLREIRTAARLQHPNILTVFDSGSAEPAPGDPTGRALLWFSMPFIEGESLRDRLRREAPLPVDDAVSIACEVSEALEYAHGRDVVHRDIKPENILLFRGRALVADFGIARALSDDDAHDAARLTQTGLALGTPAYMSPEQASGEGRLDARSDVYSLGCVLFEMLAGEPPFTGPTALAVIAKRFTETVPSPSQGGRPLPPELERVVARAMAPAPADRFPSAGALAAALRAGEPWSRRATGPEEPGRGAPPSIAVLPFANLSPSPDNEYFADGMTDELINALAKVPGLHVVSRTSCFAFKGHSEDAREIGRRLHVATVLEGSVRRAGPRLRVATQLINVTNGFLLWSESFDRETEDVFAIQDEIARAISSALRGRLLDSRAEARVRRPTDDLEAYQLYLKGRQSWNRRTEQDLQEAMRAFEQALARDPGFALAHAGMADTWALLGFYSAVPPGDAYPRAKRAARQALDLEPALAEAYPAFAYSAMYYDWDWVEAEQAFRRAIELHPGYANAHQWYGNFLSVMGRAEEAIATFERALALDPLSALKYAALGWGCYFARRYQRGEEECRRGVGLEPGNVVAHGWMTLNLLGLGRGEEAVAVAEETARLSGYGVSSLGLLGYAYGAAARRREARSVLERLIATSATRYISQYDVALIHLALGHDEAAMEWLQRGHAQRDHQMVFLKVDPRLDALRVRTDFGRLLERMRF
ncbi:MAG: protein kinase [Gemmatimonadales bacterium]